MTSIGNQISRRSFIGSMAAVGAASVIPASAFAAKPNSKFSGVQIGTIDALLAQDWVFSEQDGCHLSNQVFRSLTWAW